jgi:hypothetical protein
LKPVVEPIIVFQKPYVGRPLSCIVETGAGAINIDAGRINGAPAQWAETRGGLWKGSDGKYDEVEKLAGNGRWPSNFIVQHHPECRIIGYEDESYIINRFTDGAKPFGGGAGHEYETDDEQGGIIPVYKCHPDCAAKHLDDQGGIRKSGYMKAGTERKQGGGYHGGFPNPATTNGTYGDVGGVSRFFYQADWMDEVSAELEFSDPVFYAAKASKTERDNGLRDVEETVSGYRPNEPEEGYGGNSLSARIHRSAPRINPHPTVKPLALTEHLASLLLPPKEYAPRRILVPFSGVGSEVIGAWRAGWDEITGVEISDEYCAVAEKRVNFYTNVKGHQIKLL